MHQRARVSMVGLKKINPRRSKAAESMAQECLFFSEMSLDSTGQDEGDDDVCVDESLHLLNKFY